MGVCAMRIREAATTVGISPDTIRRLEREGLITPARDWAGHRRFSAEDLHQLRALVFSRPIEHRPANGEAS
jgi:excisionase family DNA binding protein